MLTKVGRTVINGNEMPVYLMVGKAIRDAEDKPVNGIAHAQVSCAGQERDTGTVFVTLNGWRDDRAREVGSIRKFDTVMAVGTLKEREYNGNKYFDLDADFLTVSGGRQLTGPEYAAPPALNDNFEPIDIMPDDDAGDLPF